MNVTLTGATGLIGAADRARAAGARRRRHGALARSRAGARRPRRRRGPRLAAAARACAGRGAERARRGRAPGRRERGPALDRRRRGARSATRARLGTRNLVAGHRRRRAAPARPGQRLGRRTTTARAATSRSPRTPPPGDDFLAQVCVAWEREAAARRRARAARGHAAHRRSCSTRSGGALAKMLPFFRLGIGGPVAGGRQYLPWIHADDIVGLYLAAARRRGVGGRRSTRARPSPRPTATSRAPSAARCTVPPSRPSPASRCACSTATWPRSSPPASAPCPMRALERGYAFRHTDLERGPARRGRARR